MSVQISCPECRRTLRVPEELFGKRVQCPECGVKFTAETDRGPAPEGGPKADPRDEPAPRRRPRYEEEYGEYDRPPRRDLEPHRGTLILTFGVLSLVICAPLGIAAWVMGNNDLDAMRRGRMDRSGEGTTQAGRICGMIATVFMIIGCVFYVVFFIAIAGGGGRNF